MYLTLLRRKFHFKIFDNVVYLQRMERQERFEAVLKERETQRMQYQQWSVPDPYGLSLQQ